MLYDSERLHYLSLPPERDVDYFITFWNEDCGCFDWDSVLEEMLPVWGLTTKMTAASTSCILKPRGEANLEENKAPANNQHRLVTHMRESPKR